MVPMQVAVELFGIPRARAGLAQTSATGAQSGRCAGRPGQTISAVGRNVHRRTLAPPRLHRQSGRRAIRDLAGNAAAAKATPCCCCRWMRADEVVVVRSASNRRNHATLQAAINESRIPGYHGCYLRIDLTTGSSARVALGRESAAPLPRRQRSGCGHPAERGRGRSRSAVGRRPCSRSSSVRWWAVRSRPRPSSPW